MNCPSRTDDTLEHPGWNQNPSDLNADVTTRNDLNGIANSKVHRKHASGVGAAKGEGIAIVEPQLHGRNRNNTESEKKMPGEVVSAASGCQTPKRNSRSLRRSLKTPFTVPFSRMVQSIVKFARFVGPGFLIAVAYIDPGNYATDVAAGAEYRYALLFIVLVSNLFAIFLQSLCIKLGTVTGLNLAENCREHLPRWMVYILYFLSEAAIVATDIAEVVGSAIALNLLLKIPLVAGCAITLADVLFILIFYKPDGSMLGLRVFEFFVMGLVLGVVVCFSIQLSLIRDQSVGDVFRGYLPSSAIVESTGLYQSCGILGATVMPHSMFLGSGVVQSRLKEFDVTEGYVDPSVCLGSTNGEVEYRPSLHAIRGCLKYSIVELALSLFTFALFVNSSILIVAGAALYGKPDAGEADLWGIHDLLSTSIAPAAGLIFGLALLLSGISAGIVCTMAGQMVSEGMLNWSIRPWLRRLITRSVSIIPSIIVAGAVGRKGLDKTLTASQVVLSVILPFVSAPLVYFTCRNRYMTVPSDRVRHDEDQTQNEGVKMKNNIITTVVAILIWLIIAVMNVALLVLVGLGKA
ncbi:natural resistance-associated macrophage protein-domain-containing protein [Aspergillus caelatus]|uniref:Natural resistance-associated macrophage protein-domain-containing protein n=2 Tax=Aspergillus subgen. Circumdati TaxID=2720871 RepID=A0A5N6ZT68_9EURO|nr:natural resistance-associated macrophage protein-domain-containing protein [Aspergillus caelatus]KAE8360598.1 natural resistance-associated macrophage protein-domain-containing protein [Aspergillus caelatus]KAE8413674.1 natural resistance-associated macrophage protein-domain-containing protein [Aspergillus pseudocaelatus]